MKTTLAVVVGCLGCAGVSLAQEEPPGMDPVGEYPVPYERSLVFSINMVSELAGTFGLSLCPILDQLDYIIGEYYVTVQSMLESGVRPAYRVIQTEHIHVLPRLPGHGECRPGPDTLVERRPRPGGRGSFGASLPAGCGPCGRQPAKRGRRLGFADAGFNGMGGHYADGP